jgi:hypothetical protein
MIVLRFKHSSWNAPVIHKIDKFPCTIGRSIQNRIVLSDDSVSAEHAMIERQGDGSYVLRDLESTNGIFSEGKRFCQIILRDHGVVKCGDIEMTTLLSDERLEKTRQIELPSEFKTKTQKLAKSVLIRLFLMVVFIFANIIMRDPMDNEVWIDVLLNILLTGIVAFGLSGLIAIITKVQHKKYNYLHYLNITLLYAVLWGVYDLINQRIFFWIDHRTLQRTVNLGVFFCFFWFYFTQILEVFFSGRYRRKIQLTLAALYFSGVLFIYLIATTSEKNTKFNYSAVFVYTTSEFSKEDYNFSKLTAQMNESFEEVEEYRTEKLEEKEESRQLEDSLGKENDE